MKRFFILAATILVVQVLAVVPALAPRVQADWYRWVDDEGKLHITDDIGTIPDEKRFEMELFKVTPAEKRPEVRQPAPEVRPEVSEPEAVNGGEELYGGEPLRWWKETFIGLGTEISELEDAIESKQRFVDIFLSGRRVGQIYGEDDVRTYESYSAELPGDRDSLERLMTRRDKLLQSATKAGVPKYVKELLETGEGGEAEGR